VRPALGRVLGKVEFEKDGALKEHLYKEGKYVGLAEK
jgi:hypothetical protein